MNNDIISRSALKEDFDCVGFNDYDDYNRALRIIDNAPSVEVGYLTNCANCERVEKIRAKRPQGEWISQDYDDLKISDYRCNQCGHYQDDITNFCPNCGADMRGANNG